MYEVRDIQASSRNIVVKQKQRSDDKGGGYDALLRQGLLSMLQRRRMVWSHVSFRRIKADI